MKAKFTVIIFLLISNVTFSQMSWTVCNTPPLGNRVDDITFVNAQTGYAVCGDGQILKSTDGGSNWFQLQRDTTVYCRSVKFINAQKGFVGSFHRNQSSGINTLRRTNDGGASWTDLSALLHPKARMGICGLAIADTATIYGCGNWFQDSAYIVKSTDGGNSWSYLDLSNYAASLIDMYFINRDTGFATGRSPMPLQTATILYTTDGGLSWTTKFKDTDTLEYCWKIYHLTDRIYFAGVQTEILNAPRVLKSTDGGMHWSVQMVPPQQSFTRLQGVGFIDSLTGWTGGGFSRTYQTNDGGITWDTVGICYSLNRVFKVNDSLLFATGFGIWKYHSALDAVPPVAGPATHVASLSCFPNPAGKDITIDVTLSGSTHALLTLTDERGRRIEVIDNTDKARGTFRYTLNTTHLAAGNYYLLLVTHEERQAEKIVVSH